MTQLDHAPVDVLCQVIDGMHEAMTLGINVGPGQVGSRLNSLVSIESAMANGRNFFERERGAK